MTWPTIGLILPTSISFVISASSFPSGLLQIDVPRIPYFSSCAGSGREAIVVMIPPFFTTA